MPRKYLRAALASLTLLCAPNAFAQGDHGPSAEPTAVPAAAFSQSFTAILNGANERPFAVATPGTGFGTVGIASDNNTLTVALDFADLTSGTRAGHIHCCVGVDGAAQVAVGFATSGVDPFPFDVTSGVYTRSFDLSLASTYAGGFLAFNNGDPLQARALLLDGLRDGLAYLNLHTVSNPAGEIRGQLSEVPEPATAGVLLAGLLGMVAFRRRAGVVAP